MRKKGFALAAIASALVMATGLTGCGGGNDNNNTLPGGTRAQAGRASVTAVRGIRGAALRLSAIGGVGGAGRSRAAKIAKTRQSAPREFDEDYGLWSEVDFSGSTFRILYFRDQVGGSPVGSITSSFSETGISIVYDISEGYEPSRGTLNLTGTPDEFGNVTTGNINGSIEDLLTNETSVFNLTFNQVGTDSFNQPLYRITGNMGYRDADGIEYVYNNLVIEPDGSLASDVSEGGLTGRVALIADGSGSFTLNAEDGQYFCQWDANGAGFIRYPDGTVENIGDFDTFEDYDVFG